MSYDHDADHPPAPDRRQARQHGACRVRPAQHPAAAVLRPLVLDLGIALGSFYLMRTAGVALVPALGLSSVLPAARTIIGLLKDRKVNSLAMLISAFAGRPLMARLARATGSRPSRPPGATAGCKSRCRNAAPLANLRR